MLRLALCAGVLPVVIAGQAMAADYTTNIAGTVTYDEGTKAYTAGYSEGIGGKEYTLLVVKDTREGEGYTYSVDAESILYIDQAAANASGAVSFEFGFTANEDCVVLLGGTFSDGTSPKVLGTLLAQDADSGEEDDGATDVPGSGEGNGSTGDSGSGESGGSSGDTGSGSTGGSGTGGGAVGDSTDGGSGTPTKNFTDISGHWAENYIKFVTERGIFGGTSDTTFSPNMNMTRGMLVTVLYSMNGADYDGLMDTFTDVYTGDWYALGANWAASNGVVSGVGDGKFAPNSNVTREQTAVILMGYARMMGLDVTENTTLDKFEDADQVSSWAVQAVKWAVDKGLISGKPGGLLDPQGTATRAEMATILYNFVAFFES